MLTKDEIKSLSLEGALKELKKNEHSMARTLFSIRTGQSKANHEAKNVKHYKARLLTQKRMIEMGKVASPKQKKLAKENKITENLEATRPA